MKPSTVLILAGVGFAAWWAYNNRRSAPPTYLHTLPAVPATHLLNAAFNGGVIPAYTPFDCQTPCPPGVGCAAVLNGHFNAAGVCV